MEEKNGGNFRIAEKAIRKSVLLLKGDRKKVARKTRSRTADAPETTFDFSRVIDHQKDDERVRIVCLIENGFLPLQSNLRVIQIDGLADGFYIISGALSLSDQILLAKVALEEYSNAEHTNLSNLSNQRNLFREHAEATEILTSNSNIWLESIQDNDNFERLKTLRWASLGYHYDWTKRMYEQNEKSDFPTNLAKLCKHLASIVGEEMTAEAAIVNYYPVGTYMSGHLDDAEHAMEEPIVSISLGAPAIFLLGGRTNTEVPTPILIRSGDVIIMARDSRYSYHGVPAVIPHKLLTPSMEGFSSGQENCSDKCGVGVKFDAGFCCDVCEAFLTTSAVDLPGTPEMIADENCSDQLTNSTDFCCGKHLFSRVGSLPDDILFGNESIDFSVNNPVIRYLQQGRININVRRVAKPNTVWVDKCGSGATYSAGQQA